MRYWAALLALVLLVLVVATIASQEHGCDRQHRGPSNGGCSTTYWFNR